MRKSTRTRKSAIPDDYMVYLQEMKYDIGDEDDLTSYKEAIENSKSGMWEAVMKDELVSMSRNNVWTLVENVYKLQVGF